MSFIAAIEADVKNFVAKLKEHFGYAEHPIVAEGEALEARVKSAAATLKLQGVSDAAQVEHDAVTAGETVAKDAEAAAAPVLAEAEGDAEKLGSETLATANSATLQPPAAN